MGAITLYSDGHATDSHWQSAITQLQERNIRLHTVALQSRSQTPFIAALKVSDARVTQRVKVAANLAGDVSLLNVDTVQLSLYQLAESKATTRHPLKLLARSPAYDINDSDSLPASLTLSFVAPQADFIPVLARLENAQDGSPLTSDPQQQWHDVIAIQPPLPLLHIGDSSAHESLERLLGPGFQVTTQQPEQFQGVADNALVLLNNVTASRFSKNSQQRLLQSIEQGTGLFVSGGQRAFVDDNFASSTLAPALPVRVPPQQTLNQDSIALAIVIDSSGSMMGDPLRLAKQMARLAVQKLKPSDQVGVVEFYGARQWAVPMQLAEHAELIERSIGKMQAQGGSTLFPAIEEAYFGLKNVTARYKHLLVISDAGVEENNYRQLLKHIVSENITVSTALVGSNQEGEQRMVDLARWGHGRYYSINNDFDMVQLDFNAPQLTPDEIYQQDQFNVSLHRNDWWPKALTPPPLRGFIKADKRLAATTLASVAQQPLLSSWQYGSGRVTTLLTEILGTGSETWSDWPDYGNWLARALQHTAQQQQPYQMTLQRQFSQLRVDITANQANALPPQLSRVSADGSLITEPLTRRAPHHWVAILEQPSSEAARLILQQGGWQQFAAQRADADLHAELQVANWQKLSLPALAEAGQGQYWSTVSDTLLGQSLQRQQGQRAVVLWPWLASLALILYLLDILYRRWPASWTRNGRWRVRK
nr:VWA domain-containing protein [Idiomarina rhizosphaerae]